MKAQPGQIKCAWSSPERGEPKDVCVSWGGRGASKSDGRLVLHALQGVEVFEGRDLVTELERRGFDPSSLWFSIRQKASED